MHYRYLPGAWLHKVPSGLGGVRAREVLLGSAPTHIRRRINLANPQETNHCFGNFGSSFLEGALQRHQLSWHQRLPLSKHEALSILGYCSSPTWRLYRGGPSRYGDINNSFWTYNKHTIPYTLLTTYLWILYSISGVIDTTNPKSYITNL